MWILSFRNPKLSLEFYNNINNIRYLSSKSAFITRVKRKLFLRTYPTLLVKPDGSTYTIRYVEPRRIIKLPVDISAVSEELQQEILNKRKPKKKVVIEEDVEDSFDSSQYIKLLQNRG